MKNENLIKENGLSEADMEELRENFVTRYAQFKGWDRNSLSTEQLNEIIHQPEYKKAGLILG